jgi:hypothetical protein
MEGASVLYFQQCTDQPYRKLIRKTKGLLFASAHRTFPKTDPMLDHKARSNKLKRTEIMASNFTDHNNMKL